MPNPQNVIGKGHRFKKGETGNPKGRPPVIPELKALLAEVMGEEKQGLTAVKALLKSLMQRAIKGDTAAARELLDRAYGKATLPIDHTTGGDKITTYQIEVSNPETATKLNKWLNEND